MKTTTPGLSKRKKKALARWKAKCSRWKREYRVTDLWIEAQMRTPCPYCGWRMEQKTASLDHMVPISRGGMCDMANSQLIHMRCNDQKGNFTDDEFRMLLVFVRTKMPQMEKNLLARLKQGWRASLFVKPTVV